ncbi:MAG: GNAT family N-acetyltransferase, partial [Terriglobales bacterium]
MLTIRAATIADAALLRRMIWELADYEKEPDQVWTTEADIARDGFGANPQFHALIAEWHGQPAGFALFFGYYSSWRGAGVFLEDLF